MILDARCEHAGMTIAMNDVISAGIGVTNLLTPSVLRPLEKAGR